MWEGPAVAILWLLTPAIVVMGTVSAALAFDGISRLGSRTRQIVRTARDGCTVH